MIALAFQKATLPAEWLGDLRSLADDARLPLACRSSSALEDALGRPFAGVYGTKMIPGNQPDVAGRFKSLVDAVKFVFATTFFHEARAYRRAAGELPEPEKMAVVVQEVVGRRHGDRFYPDLSGVARSYNFYPVGPAQPAEGVVDLALGLGKTIVDGGLCWSFSPAHPKLPPPVGSVRDLARRHPVPVLGGERRPAAALRPDDRDGVPRRALPRRGRGGRHAALRRLDLRRRLRPSRRRHRAPRAARPRLRPDPVLERAAPRAGAAEAAGGVRGGARAPRSRSSSRCPCRRGSRPASASCRSGRSWSRARRWRCRRRTSPRRSRSWPRRPRWATAVTRCGTSSTWSRRPSRPG